jgi:hypothetical protein
LARGAIARLLEMIAGYPITFAYVRAFVVRGFWMVFFFSSKQKIKTGPSDLLGFQYTGKLGWAVSSRKRYEPTTKYLTGARTRIDQLRRRLFLHLSSSPTRPTKKRVARGGAACTVRHRQTCRVHGGRCDPAGGGRALVAGIR